MAQRQFRSDDTDFWREKYGNGAAGAATLSGTYGNGVGGHIGPCSGTAGAYSLTISGGWSLAYGGWPCVIHQTREGGSGVGNWELNYITNIVSTTATLRYPLIYNYNSTSQVILMLPYANLTIGNLNGYGWNGTYGGITPFLCTGVTTLSGYINQSGTGYRGNTYRPWDGNDRRALTGEGTGGAAFYGEEWNGNGGGAGDNSSGMSCGAGGGGHYTTGVEGDGPDNRGGNPGQTSGNVQLTNMTFGGAGGTGGTSDDGSLGGSGGYGGGIILLISRIIQINSWGAVNGTVGGNPSPGGANDSSAGGGGAAGSILLKGQVINLGNGLLTATAGAGGVEIYGPGQNGGAGSVGRIHADYLSSITGYTSPAADVRQDTRLTADTGAATFFL